MEEEPEQIRISVFTPIIYLSILITGFVMFSVIYRRRKVKNLAKVEPLFEDNYASNVYAVLKDQYVNAPKEDKPHDKVMKAALLRRGVEAIRRSLRLKEAEPTFKTLYQDGLVGDDIFKQFTIQVKFQELEIKEIVEECETYKKNWAQLFFKVAQEICFNEALRRRLKAMDERSKDLSQLWDYYVEKSEPATIKATEHVQASGSEPNTTSAKKNKKKQNSYSRQSPGVPPGVPPTAGGYPPQGGMPLKGAPPGAPRNMAPNGYPPLNTGPYANAGNFNPRKGSYGMPSGVPMPTNGSFIDPNISRVSVTNKIRDDCYNKHIKDGGNNVREITYLTHINIKEFSQFASTPPPSNVPESNLGSIKDRILVLCSKYSGRVLLQKGKFNDQKNQYQIGRTWDLDELKAVTKAGPSGIILSLNKDYYWKCSEEVERVDRFIKHLVKTFGSYTGKYPVINGFTLDDLELPPVPTKKAFGVSVNNSDEVLTPQPDVQLLKSKSLKRKNLPNPVLPVAPQQPIPKQSQMDFYKDIDFTANGKLPVKPMKVLDRSPNVSQTSVSDYPPTNNNTLNDVSSASMLGQGQQNHPYRSITPGRSDAARSDAELTNDSQSFIFSPQDLQEETQELPKQRNSKSSDRRVSGRKVSERLGLEAFQNNAALHMKLEERLSRPDLDDFGIEEVVDSDGDFPGSPKKREEKQEEIEVINVDDSEDLNDVSQSSNLREEKDLSAIDSSIQEIEAFMDSQLNFGGSIKRPKESRSREVTQAEISDVDVLDTRSLSTINTEPANESDIDVGLHLKDEKDPEVEELLDELHWDVEDDSDRLIKKLTGQLNKIKYQNVKELINLDFSGDSMKEDLGTSLNEIENVNQVFKKMEIGFKKFGPEINAIENNSQGLQVKSVNKRVLYNDLNSILSKISVSARDLSSIESFKDFDRLNRLEGLEAQILTLHNALETIKQDQDGFSEEKAEINSMNALKKYLSNYEAVANKFVGHFISFFKAEYTARMDRLFELDRVPAKLVLTELSALTIYAPFTYFIKEFSSVDLHDLRLIVNSKLSEFLEFWLKLKLKAIKSTGSITHNIPASRPDTSDHISSLRKSRTLRLSVRKDKLINKLGFLEESPSTSPKPNDEAVTYTNTFVTPNGIEDTKTIVDVVNDTRELSLILSIFLGQIFHYENNVYDLNEYLQLYPFQRRLENLDHASIDVSGYSGELTTVLNNVFGNFTNLFIKKVVPIEYNIPILLAHLEVLTKDSHDLKHDFFAFNFLKKVLDKFKSNWTKFVNNHVEALNKSSISAKSGILPSVKNINQFFHLVESTLDKPSIEDTEIKPLVGQSYKDITEACIHLFAKDDPLLKNNDFDEKERNSRNVSILQNIFSILEQVSIFNNERTNKIKAQLDLIFKKVEDTYSKKLLHQNIGKIVEFVDNFEALTDNNVKAKKYNKKAVKAILSGYNTKELANRAAEIRRKLEKHFLSGSDMFEKDLLDKLWADMEKQFVNYFFRLDNILSRNFGDIDFHISKQEIHSIFRSLT